MLKEVIDKRSTLVLHVEVVSPQEAGVVDQLEDEHDSNNDLHGDHIRETFFPFFFRHLFQREEKQEPEDERKSREDERDKRKRRTL